jgi:hypothetical protein
MPIISKMIKKFILKLKHLSLKELCKKTFEYLRGTERMEEKKKSTIFFK